jgi:hypothetical protein
LQKGLKTAKAKAPTAIKITVRVSHFMDLVYRHTENCELDPTTKTRRHKVIINSKLRVSLRLGVLVVGRGCLRL